MVTDDPAKRKVSVSINIRAGSMTQAEAQELEDKIRDVADDYPTTEVQASRGPERPSFRP